MTKQSKILILGYGEMGHAMEYLLREQQTVAIWTRHSRDGSQTGQLEDAAAQADIILFCLPVNPHQEIAEVIAPLLKPQCLCLSIAKGLDEAGRTAAQIFSNVFGVYQPYGLIYGPMISEEIQASRYAFAQVACSKVEHFNSVEDLFSGTKFYIEASSDITGISWSVILKNVYALAFGMADELRFGDNMRGFLAVIALKEINEIISTIGGQAGTPYHLAGLGDLITTATSESSHHHELGRMLARDDIKGIQGEGIHTLKMVEKFQLLKRKNYSLFNLIHNIVLSPSKVRIQFEEYLKSVK